VRYYLILFCATIGFTVHAQRKMVEGRVLDQNRISLPSVHVRNMTIDKITVSSANGTFHMPAQPGDTLFLTSVGFKSLEIIVENNWFDSPVNLTMIEGSIELSEVTINSIPSIELFKERVVNLELKDSVEFWYFGVEKPVLNGDKLVETNKYKSPLFAIFHPTSFLYYNFSKREKEKRKIYNITKTQPVRDRAFKKFSRDWVKTETGLDGDTLTSFIAFCDFDIYYLDSTSLFMIKENMMAKLEEFRDEGKG
jgi:hypothetical protein